MTLMKSKREQLVSLHVCYVWVASNQHIPSTTNIIITTMMIIVMLIYSNSNHINNRTIKNTKRDEKTFSKSIRLPPSINKIKKTMMMMMMIRGRERQTCLRLMHENVLPIRWKEIISLKCIFDSVSTFCQTRWLSCNSFNYYMTWIM